MNKFKKAKNAIIAVTACAFFTGVAFAQDIGGAAGGLETAAVGTTESVVAILEGIVPFVLVGLVIWAAVLIAATKRNYIALGCVVLAAFIISQVDNIIALAQAL